MQTNLADCCPELIPFSYTLLPFRRSLQDWGLHKKISPLQGKCNVPVQDLLPSEIILVPWVGSGDPYTFSNLCTIDEGLKIIPPMLPYASGDSRVLSGHAGLVGHR